MATSISAILIVCLKSFNQLQEQVERPDYTRKAEVSSISWGDELGRLRVWAANIGAHQTGQSSLDFRLRDASHISKQITKLLQDLEQSLHEIFNEISHTTEAPKDDKPSIAWPGDESTTEFQQLHEEVINIIDCLYQLSMLIRKPAQHDMFVGSYGDKAEFEFYDKEHVRNLHPKTGEQISQRLGRAITRRRMYLLYRERHHRKLEKSIEEVQGVRRPATGSVMSGTIATDFKTPNINFEETSSISGISETNYASSLVDGGKITIPPPPKGSVRGKPFECPYCFFVIEIKSTGSWNQHIFKDIKPYVCTFPDCRTPDRLYDSRHEWSFHETTEHHRKDLSCPLCKDTLKSSKLYEWHVARHLEELSLFALPRTEMDDEEHNDDNKDVINARIPTDDEGSKGSSIKSRPRSAISSRTPTHSTSGLPEVTNDEGSKDTGIKSRLRSAMSSRTPTHSTSGPRGVTDDKGSKGTSMKSPLTSVTSSRTPTHSTPGPPGVTDDESSKSTSRISRLRSAASSHTSTHSIPGPRGVTDDEGSKGTGIKSRLRSAVSPSRKPTESPGRGKLPDPQTSMGSKSSHRASRPPPPPPPPRPSRWRCGSCGFGAMSIRLDLFCVNCRRRKDDLATEE